MRILVTGADGFVGRHLCAALRVSGHVVVEPAGPASPGGLQLTDPGSVLSAVERAEPEAVIHLAAASSVAASHQEPVSTFAVNALGTVHLLDAMHRAARNARLLLVSTGEVYGRASSPPSAPGAHRATREDAPLEPLSPYAASKVAGEVAALQFHRSYGTQVVIARPFGHVGPGQTTRFVIPSFAAQIVAIGRGTVEPVIRTGDLSPIRDFLHVADVIAAYEILLASGTSGAVYNVASERGRSVRNLLDAMLAHASVTARVEVDPAKVRPVEIPVLVGDASRLRALGWAPKQSVETALAEVLAEHDAAT